MKKMMVLGSAMLAATAAFVAGCEKAEPQTTPEANVALDQPAAVPGVQSDVVALPPPPKDTDVIATVGDAQLTWAGLNKEVDETISMVVAYSGRPIPTEELPQAKQEIRRSIVQRFVVENIITQSAAKEGVALDAAYLAQEIAKLEAESGKKFDEMLAAHPAGAEKAKELFNKSLLEKRLLDEKVFSGILVSEEEVQAALDKNVAETALVAEAMADYTKQITADPTAFDALVQANSLVKTPIEQPEQMMGRIFGAAWPTIAALKPGEMTSVLDLDGAKAIVRMDGRKDAEVADPAAAKAKIESIRERLLKGEDFAKLAAEYSDCPSGQRAGGDLGFFGKGMMVKEFEDAADTQEIGVIGDIVQTQFGYHIVKVTERNEAEKTVRASHILVKTEGGAPATVTVTALLLQTPPPATAESLREEKIEQKKRQAAMEYFNAQRKALGVTCTLFPELAADPTR